MIGETEIQEHYGQKVLVNTLTEQLRRSECLCLNCELMQECTVAKELYDVCCQDNLALMVTRCRRKVEYTESGEE